MDARLLGLLQTGALRPLDAHFADLLLRHAEQPTPELALAAALVSRHAGDGHVCLPLARVAGQAPFDTPWRAPAITDWHDGLLASGVVGEPGDPGEPKPLILDAAGRLYLERLWRDEDLVARDLSARAAPRVDIDPAALAAPLRRLFPGDDPGTVGQRRAAAVAALHGLGILCGGPGTGKTHTVARLLALLVELAGDRPPRIALAAPTGKAAQRLAESLRKSADVLPAGFKLPDSVPTLHRLLGLRPDGSARHDADHPLACDLLLIDEASMVDLPLLARTLRALPATARLVLLGDPNQLASVEAGAVLGELCAGAGGYSMAGAARLAAATGDAAPGGGPGGIGDAIALLEHSYRFDGGGAIGRLAAAVNAGDAAAALDLLRAGGAVRFEAIDTPAALNARIGGHVAPALQPLFKTADAAIDPGAALARLGEFQVLTALREGPFGVMGVNAAIERALHRRGLIRGQAVNYSGRPLLVGSNDYALGLFNGDLGLLLPDATGTLRAWFAGPDGTARPLTPTRLPAHESAYALTVHKSQGSEFEDVLLILPPQPNPLLTRELIYTALTRARSGVTVWGAEATLAAAIGRRLERDSGLADRLCSE